MDIAIQLASNDKIVRAETIQDIKDHKSLSLLTKAKGGEDMVAMIPAT